MSTFHVQGALGLQRIVAAQSVILDNDTSPVANFGGVLPNVGSGTVYAAFVFEGDTIAASGAVVRVNYNATFRDVGAPYALRKHISGTLQYTLFYPRATTSLAAASPVYAFQEPTTSGVEEDIHLDIGTITLSKDPGSMPQDNVFGLYIVPSGPVQCRFAYNARAILAPNSSRCTMYTS